MTKFVQLRSFFVALLGIVLSFTFVVVVTYSASTISTNISTGGTLTVNGNSTFGDAATDVNLFTGTLQASTTALFTSGFTTYGNWTIDQSGTTTATFNQAGLNFDSNTLVIDSYFNRVGVASSTPYVALGVTGTTTSSAGVVIGEAGSGVSQLSFGTCSVNLPSIPVISVGVVDCTATGVTAGSRVFVTPTNLEASVVFSAASSTSANTIQVAAYNASTTGAINPAAQTWSWMAIR